MQGGGQQQSQQEDEDPSTFPVNDDDGGNNNNNALILGGQPINLNQNDHAWPTAEGYTPLGDVFHLGSILVAMPPEDDDDDDDVDGDGGAPNSFVADPMALFGNVNTTNHDNIYGNNGNNENEGIANDNNTSPDDDDDDGNNNTTATQQQQQQHQQHGGGGFRDLADTALLALENDYEMTLRGEVRPSLMDSQQQHQGFGGPSMSLFDATSFSNSNNNNNNATTTTNTTINDDETTTNFADFDSMNNSNSNSNDMSSELLPKIDTAAVQKAVAGIITNNTSLQTKLQKWQSEKDNNNNQTANNNYQHQLQLLLKENSVIPTTPLKAFDPNKKTPKAIKATANLTRSATIANCLHRLSYLLKCQERLSIHIVGADHVECSSATQIQTTFSPLVRWINSNLYSPQHLDLLLIGPNVPTNMHMNMSNDNDNNDNNNNKSAPSPSPIQLLSQQQQSKQRLHSATAICHQASYHDWLGSLNTTASDTTTAGPSPSSLPDLVVCFNAGIWGYDEWKPTIRALCQCSSSFSNNNNNSSNMNNKRIPFVVTSYTLEEAEDDHDVIQEVVIEQQQQDNHSNNDKKMQEEDIPCSSLIWGPEINYFGSKQKRETATAVEGREYRENAAWQAWRL